MKVMVAIPVDRSPGFPLPAYGVLFRGTSQTLKENTMAFSNTKQKIKDKFAQPVKNAFTLALIAFIMAGIALFAAVVR